MVSLFIYNIILGWDAFNASGTLTVSPTYCVCKTQEIPGPITKVVRSSLLRIIAVVELVYLLRLLPDRYAFTVPGIDFLGIHDYPVMLPDIFLIATPFFWSPALVWAIFSIAIPSFFGYFFSFSRGRASGSGSSINPLTFIIVKAITVYFLCVQGFTFGGWVDPIAVARINSVLSHGWWKGMLLALFSVLLMPTGRLTLSTSGSTSIHCDKLRKAQCSEASKPPRKQGST